MLPFLISLPERMLRAGAALIGGAARETAAVLLPSWLRGAALYRMTLDRLLRLTIEQVGGVTDVYPDEPMGLGELAARKAAGNALEAAAILALGWSPLWALAAAADLTGGTRLYLRTLVVELRRLQVLPPDEEYPSMGALLERLESTSGALAESMDLPPVQIGELKRSWRSFQRQAPHLPEPAELARLYGGLQQTAREEGRSLIALSTLIAAGAVRSGLQVGHTYLFSYYADSLGAIQEEGLPAYLRRVARPYAAAVARHFDRRRRSHTEALVARLGRRWSGDPDP